MSKTDTGDTVNPGSTLDVLSGGTISNTTDALQQREHIMTPAETKARRVLALRFFYALRAHYPNKNVALSIVPRDVADDEPDDLTLPNTAG
jgi:hypothetical protein